MITDWLNRGILLILTVSTIIQVLNWTGLLPKYLKNKMKLSNAEDTIKVLERMGVDFDFYLKNNTKARLPVDYSQKDIKEETQKCLESIKLDIKVSVGRNRSTKSDYYYDLIGKSCNPKYAEEYARLLSTYLSEAIDKREMETPKIDFVVTPKGGSPILGYEFAKLIEKPFVLHELEQRFRAENDIEDMRSHFDCAEKPEKGKTALIVDDSSTGGRMVLDTVKDLRAYGYEVRYCLVVFAPQSKDAKKKLSDVDVKLISIVDTHIQKKKKTKKVCKRKEDDKTIEKKQEERDNGVE